VEDHHRDHHLEGQLLGDIKDFLAEDIHQVDPNDYAKTLTTMVALGHLYHLLEVVPSFLYDQMVDLVLLDQILYPSLRILEKIIVLFSDFTIMHTLTNEKDLIYSVNAF
jgi:hypothetical protein